MRNIFVTGATGNQGGAVARHLISNGFHVKALTRNANSANAQQLKRSQAEIIQGDLNDSNTFKDHLKGVDGVFSVQTFFDGVKKEIKQGTQLVDLAREYNIPHFLYSSVAGADWKTGIPHFDSKLTIENYLKASGLSYTIIRPVSLFENFLIPEVRKRLVKGKMVTSLNRNVVQQHVSCDDIGKLSVRIFKDVARYKGVTMTIAAEQMDVDQVVSLFSETWGRKVEYQKLPMLITRLVLGRDLYKMFKWQNENSGVFVKDLQGFRNEFGDMMSLQDWIKQNFKEQSV